MSERLYHALEVCLEAVETGVSVEECLHLYPDLADELRPVLEGALLARSLKSDTVPVEAMNRSRTRLLGAAARLREADEKRPRAFAWLSRPQAQQKRAARTFSLSTGRLLIALLLAAVLIFTSSSIAVVSAEALPGDTLYPVKRAVEEIRINLSPSLDEKRVFIAQSSQQRISEVQQLLAQGRVQAIGFEGVVESMTSTEWVVSGIEVMVTPETTIRDLTGYVGAIEVGMRVEVKGLTHVEGWVAAQAIDIHECRIDGLLESISDGEWVVNGTHLKINADTQIDLTARVGDTVLVLARAEDDAVLYALAIIRLSGEGPGKATPASSPSTSASPTATPLPPPSATPMPTPRPDPTPEDELEFTGKIQAITASYWIINGQIFYITSHTEIKDDLVIGETARVHAYLEPNGSMTAIEISKEDGSGSGGDDGGSGEEPSETPEDSETPEETETPEGTETETETSTPDGGGHGGDDGTHTPTPTPTP